MHEKMRKDEEFGREAFHRYLLSVSVQEIEWETGKEPPDFELVCERGRFAVEVTQIMGSFQIKGRRRPERFWANSISAAISEMEQEGAKRGLQGVFCLDVEPIADLSPKVRARIQNRVFDYARVNKLLPKASPMEVWRDGVESRWAISKISAGQFSIWHSYSSGDDWNGPDDIQRELDSLVADTLADKQKKTSHLDNVVLVLIDDYHFGRRNQWLQSAEQSHPSHFCMIVRAYEDYRCQILFDHGCSLTRVDKPWGDPRGLA